MKSVLMVCLGNICRSPLAEGVLRYKLEKAGIKNIRVDSAGTSDYHVGDPPDTRSAQNAKQHGIDISNLCGRQFSVTDFDEFDLIYVMDASNYQNVIRLARNESDKTKVDFLLNAKWPGKNMAVPDPYYGSGDGFEKVFQLVDEACEEIVKRVLSSG
ncbi:MAG: low molecular weight phosphotyrosine protein phosphatase [Bacteroidota bacterium]|nr:low molecular weight phosphotyrosine protein phosphatase [Bacteroidota bacterium]